MEGEFEGVCLSLLEEQTIRCHSATCSLTVKEVFSDCDFRYFSLYIIKMSYDGRGGGSAALCFACY